jgi:hypothetical protein
LLAAIEVSASPPFFHPILPIILICSIVFRTIQADDLKVACANGKAERCEELFSGLHG